MAQPIPFHTPPVDARAALHARLEHAPDKHAEAILAVYELLQALHDRGVLETTTSALRASDELLGKLVDNADTPDVIRAIRNLMFWRQVLGKIEPVWFQGIFQAIPDGLAMASAQRDKPVSIWRVIKHVVNPDSLRGLIALVDFLQSFGRHLHMLESKEHPPRPRSAATS